MRAASVAPAAALALVLSACGSERAVMSPPASRPAVVSPPSRPAGALSPRADAHPAPGPRVAGRRSEAGPFAILRRPPRPADRLPARALEAVRRGNGVHLAGVVTLDPSSARRVTLPGFPPVWVLGAPGAICLMTAAPGARRTGSEYALSCVPPEAGALGRLVRTYGDVALHPPQVLVEGVVPDDARGLTLDLGGERHQRLSTRENVFAGLARAPLSVSYHTGSVHRTILLPLAPGSPGALLGAGGPLG
ncbi:MAG TPA: hypothetical protein VGN08_05670 [Solirubrobacteraceae bacterium]|jgi:hypothetical protein